RLQEKIPNFSKFITGVGVEILKEELVHAVWRWLARHRSSENVIHKTLFSG
ncbi:hypothetical protein PanWU01x14_082370, partial [Parasponia andersonii]